MRKEEVEVQKLSTLAEELDILTDRTALRTGRSTLDSSRFGSARSRQSSALNETARQLQSARRLHLRALSVRHETDIELVCGIGPNRQAVEAHVQLLKLRSNYFRDKLKGRWAAEGRVHVLKELDPSNVKDVVRYIHNGRMERSVLENKLEALHRLGLFFEIDGLVNICNAYRGVPES